MPESEQEKAERLVQLDKAVLQLKTAIEFQRLWESFSPKGKVAAMDAYAGYYNEKQKGKTNA